MKLIVGILLIFGFASCTQYILPPKVKMRTEIEYFYARDKHFKRSTWRKTKQKTGYESYDKAGKLTEEGEYGEVWNYRRVTRNADSSIGIVVGHGRYKKKLNSVNYYIFDSAGKKTQDECWRFKDNHKSTLRSKTTFGYNADGKITKETEYDENNKIFRVVNYLYLDSFRTITTDSVFDEGIVGIEGKSQDTTIADSEGRPVIVKHYYNDKILTRSEFRYDKWGYVTTELTYDSKPDSLWCITKWEYNIDNQLKRKLWIVVGDKTETKDNYIYNRKHLLVKIMHYSGDELRGFTKYKYKLYR